MYIQIFLSALYKLAVQIQDMKWRGREWGCERSSLERHIIHTLNWDLEQYFSLKLGKCTSSPFFSFPSSPCSISPSPLLHPNLCQWQGYWGDRRWSQCAQGQFQLPPFSQSVETSSHAGCTTVSAAQLIPWDIMLQRKASQGSSLLLPCAGRRILLHLPIKISTASIHQSVGIFVGTNLKLFAKLIKTKITFDSFW